MRHLTFPDAKEVLTSLSNHDVVHFACHSLSDPVDPSKGGVILQKPGRLDVERVADMLTVRQISDIKLKHARIAFLSIYSTAETRF